MYIRILYIQSIQNRQMLLTPISLNFEKLYVCISQQPHIIKFFFFLISLDWDLTASSFKVPVDKKIMNTLEKITVRPVFIFII